MWSPHNTQGNIHLKVRVHWKWFMPKPKVSGEIPPLLKSIKVN